MRNMQTLVFSIVATMALMVDVCCSAERQSLAIGRRVKGDKLLQSEILAGPRNIDGLTKTFLGDNQAKITWINVMNRESMTSANSAIISGGPDFTYVTLQFNIRNPILDPEFELYVKIYGIDKSPEAENNIPGN